MTRIKGSVCSASGCKSEARCNAGGAFVCSVHYQRWARLGTVDIPNRRKSKDGMCTVDGCERPVRSTNAAFCEAHYCRIRREQKDAFALFSSHCPQCGTALKRYQKFCSPTCQCRASRGTPHHQTCKICDKRFPTKHKAEVCSPKCKIELLKANRHIRRARIWGREREIFAASEIFERDEWRCQLCGKKTNRKVNSRHKDAPSLDHILPIKLGGGHTRANTQCTHLSCNFIKQGRAIGQLRMFG